MQATALALNDNLDMMTALLGSLGKSDVDSSAAMMDVVTSVESIIKDFHSLAGQASEKQTTKHLETAHEIMVFLKKVFNLSLIIQDKEQVNQATYNFRLSMIVPTDLKKSHSLLFDKFDKDIAMMDDSNKKKAAVPKNPQGSNAATPNVLPPNKQDVGKKPQFDALPPKDSVVLIGLLATLEMEAGTNTIRTHSTGKEMLKQLRSYLVIDLISASAYTNFGRLSSHVYRSMFLNLCKKHAMEAKDIYHMTKLFVVIKNVVNVRRDIGRFKDESWYIKVKNFVDNVIVHKTLKNGDLEHFPDVCLPSCNPSMSAFQFMMVQGLNEVTVDIFIANLWAAQLNLSDDMQEKQMSWEKEFWADTVVYDKEATIKGFQPKYYANKVQDSYPLLNVDSSTSVSKINSTIIKTYIMECQSFYAKAHPEESLKNQNQ